MLFSLHTLALTKVQLESINALQRKMLRSIVGWVRVNGEDWSETAAQLSKLDIVRRRMLRSIVGRVPVVNGDWHDAMSRMNQKLQNAYRIYPTKSWPERILRGKFRCAAKIACKVNHWPVLCSRWQPSYFYEGNFHVQPRKRPGRPPKRWDDQLRVFSEHVFHSSWTTAARHGAQWLSHEQAFVQFCSEP